MFRPEMLEDGIVNLAAIVGAIIVLIGTIPAVLLITKPKVKKNG